MSEAKTTPAEAVERLEAALADGWDGESPVPPQYVIGPCPEPGSNRHDPYAARLAPRDGSQAPAASDGEVQRSETTEPNPPTPSRDRTAEGGE